MNQYASLLNRTRAAHGKALAQTYFSLHRREECPILFLERVLDPNTLSNPCEFWVERYNAVAHAYFGRLEELEDQSVVGLYFEECPLCHHREASDGYGGNDCPECMERMIVCRAFPGWDSEVIES